MESFMKSAQTIVTLAAGVVMLAAAPLAKADCKLDDLKGSFGYTVTGTILANIGPLGAGPFAAVGRIVFDAKGGVTTVRTFSDNGFVLRDDPGMGTYTLNPDCTGSFNVTVGPPGNTIQLNLDIVIDDDGDEIRGIVTVPGIVLVLEGRKMK
jgi:hypothetical protein